MAFEWHVLIEEDKDDSLQFAKVFPIKSLKVASLPKFSPPPFLHYTVIILKKICLYCDLVVCSITNYIIP